MDLLRVHSEEEILFWRNILPPEEEKGVFAPMWRGGYRWFRDPKILCIEHYRRATPDGDVKAA
jgi:hypothetical protein